MKKLVYTALVMFILIALCEQASGNQSKSGREYMIHFGLAEAGIGVMPLQRSPTAQMATATLHRHVDRPPRRQRNPQLSSTQLVVIAYDEHESELARVIMPDPRLLRAEEISANGDIGHRTLHRDNADFPVVLPDDANVKVIRIFHPRWTGTEFVLDALGSTLLP